MSHVKKCGTLSFVATPIGNLQDITYRAIALLQQVDYIFAEDTRITQRLLQHYGITGAKLTACHTHNEAQQAQRITRLLEQGYNIAYVSDAGTPLISDPGDKLVMALAQANLPMQVIPGPCAAISALCLAGCPYHTFTFHGFLPARTKARCDTFKQLAPEQTHIFYEAPHRLLATLADLQQTCPTYQIVIAKELTKQHERVLRGNASHLLATFETHPDWCKGEFVMVIDTGPAIVNDQYLLTTTELLDQFLAYLPVKAAAKAVSELTGIPKNTLYQQALVKKQASLS